MGGEGGGGVWITGGISQGNQQRLVKGTEEYIPKNRSFSLMIKVAFQNNSFSMQKIIL